MNENVYDMVSQYFRYLAMTFPVMCASDEFHFLPRAENARNYYHRMESLHADDIEEVISKIKDFWKAFSMLENQETDLETRFDIRLVKANISGILIELETKKIWRYSPLLYLKIAFIGLDHAITKPLGRPDDFAERFYGRLSTIPLLFHNAMVNISTVPETYHQLSLAMVSDAKDYVNEIKKTVGNMITDGMCDVNLVVLDNLFSSMEIFRNFLQAVTIVPDHHISLNSLELSLKDHFVTQRSLDEIYDIGVNEYNKIKNDLDGLASQIDPGKSWQELYHEFMPMTGEDMDVLSLYRSEMEKMRLFFSEHFFSKDLADPAVEIQKTPTYLRSVRGTASFGAALTADSTDISYFFITTQLPKTNTKESDVLLKKRLHKEYKFLTAHETIPGHHLIDSVRRGIDNPVRRQIESPLFYEGWASYVESLLEDIGYVDTPMDCLIEKKRELWRAARCQIDAGIPAGKLTIDDAMNLLATVGFSAEEAKRQVNRFRLNPGYQLCYTLGAYEIVELKKKFCSSLGKERFHRFFLEGGQLPFGWIEERFEALKK